jgi:pullulanase/glycogen debranching enzyme
MKLGWLPREAEFRLLAPKATAAWLVERPHPDGTEQRLTAMHPAGQGVWRVVEPDPWPYYRFRVEQADGLFEFADPRAQSVARQWRVGQPAWAVAQQSQFDWRGDEQPGVALAHAVILELHVRDFTVHPSARNPLAGTFAGLAVDAPGVAGLASLRDLGVNVVELLPVASWPVLEQRRNRSTTGVNHWGYMPSFLFAATERYSQRGAQAQPDSWPCVDADGTWHDPGDELRALVKALHRAGIAVVLDVVFNHVSIHDEQPLLRLDPGTWFHRHADGSLRSHSGCGNDLDTRDPAMRQLVVDAAVHWLESYHLDGLRLDLAELLDDDTLRALRQACLLARPGALLTAEPWSLGGYRPHQLAHLGYAVWDDQFRNLWKGRHPRHGRGALFAAWQSAAGRRDAALTWAGSSQEEGGPFASANLAVSYLEAHDDHTLGDFIRLAQEVVLPAKREVLAPVDGEALRLHKLAALVLASTRGPIMLAQGQEWGRSKVVAGRLHHASAAGRLDGNSWHRDDATNHLDWNERVRNTDLVAWYRRALTFRREWLLPAWSSGVRPQFVAGTEPHALGFHLTTPRGQAAVLVNPDGRATWFDLPGGPWWLHLGADEGHIVPTAAGVSVKLAPQGACVLVSALAI